MGSQGSWRAGFEGLLIAGPSGLGLPIKSYLVSTSWELGFIQRLEMEQVAPQHPQGRCYHQHTASAGILWPGRAAECWELPVGPWAEAPEVSYVLPSLFLPPPSICHTSPIRPKTEGSLG